MNLAKNVFLELHEFGLLPVLGKRLELEFKFYIEASETVDSVELLDLSDYLILLWFGFGLSCLVFLVEVLKGKVVKKKFTKLSAGFWDKAKGVQRELLITLRPLKRLIRR